MCIRDRVTAVYNMADTFFVAQLGTSAAGAVGIVFSLMAVIQAIGFMLGMGAGNLVSRYLGAKEQRQADCACLLYTSSPAALPPRNTRRWPRATH